MKDRSLEIIRQVGGEEDMEWRKNNGKTTKKRD